MHADGPARMRHIASTTTQCLLSRAQNVVRGWNSFAGWINSFASWIFVASCAQYLDDGRWADLGVLLIVSRQKGAGVTNGGVV